MEDGGGNPMRKCNRNPMLDTCAYNIQFPDGTLKSFNMNMIAENLYFQVDAKGNEYLSLSKQLSTII